MNSFLRRTVKKALAWSALSGLAFGAFSAMAEETSFEAVEKNLDRKGSFYLYFDGKDTFQSVETWLQKMQTMAMKTMEKNRAAQSDAKEAQKVFAFILTVYRTSGIGSTEGFGMSSVKIDNGLYRSKTLLYCPKAKQQGLIWNSLGKAPHGLDALKMMPPSTVIGSSTDLDLKTLWSRIKESLAKNDLADMVAKMGEAEQGMKDNGLDLDKVFASYDGEFGGMLTMDKSKPVNLPIPNLKKPVSIPSPGLTFFLRTKDDALFDLLASKMPMLKPLEKVGAKAIGMEAPLPLPIPVALQPILARKGPYLIFASSPEVLNSVFAAMDGGPNITGTENFKRLSKGIDLKGNGFMYCDHSLTDIFSEIISVFPNEEVDLAELYDKESVRFECFKVAAQSDEGLASTVNSNKSGLSILAGQTMVVPIMAGMLLPALNSAREKARRISCAGNLKQIGLGLKQYSMDNEDKFPAKDGAAGLEEIRKQDYLTDPKVYTCPSMSTVAGALGAPLGENTVDYIYLGGGWTEEISGDMPLALDKLGNHDRYVNILFADGHVTGYPGTYRSISEVVQKLFSNLEPKEKKLLLDKAAALDKVYGYPKGTVPAPAPMPAATAPASAPGR